jgi:hypothetical protein
MLALSIDTVEEYIKNGILYNNIVSAYYITKNYLENNEETTSKLDFIPRRKIAYIKCSNTINTLEYSLNIQKNVDRFGNILSLNQTYYTCKKGKKGDQYNKDNDCLFIMSKNSTFIWKIRRKSGVYCHVATNGSQNDCLDALDSLFGENRYDTDVSDDLELELNQPCKEVLIVNKIK